MGKLITFIFIFLKECIHSFLISRNAIEIHYMSTVIPSALTLKNAGLF